MAIGYLCLVFLFDTFSSQNLPLSNFWHFLFKLNFFARIFSVGWGYRVAAVHAETWQQGCEMAMKLSAQKPWRKWRDNVTMSCIDAICNRISQQATSRSFLIFALPRWRNNAWTCEWKAFAQDSFACGMPRRDILGMYLTALAFCSTALLVSLRTHKIHQPELVLQHGTPLWALWIPAMPGSKTGLSIFCPIDFPRCQTCAKPAIGQWDLDCRQLRSWSLKAWRLWGLC